MTPVRIVCANTQSAAIGSAKASFAIRHTGGARASIQEARDALKLSWRYVQAFEAEAAKLYAAPMDTEQVRSFANTLLEVDSAGSEATARHRRERPPGSSSCGPPPPSRPSRAPGGRPTTRSPNTLTTSFLSEVHAPRATQAQHAHCATSPPPAAADP